MLAVVDSKEKQKRIATQLNGQFHWIGLYRDPKDTSRWLWVDGSRLCNSCSYWHEKEPNNYGGTFEGCGEMYNFWPGLWNDWICWGKHRFICQKKGWYYSFVDQSVIGFSLKYD